MSTSSTRSPGARPSIARRQHREVGRARCPPDPDDAAAVGTQGDAQRRALRAATDHVLAAPQHSHRCARLFGQRRRHGRDGAVTLPAEGAPVRQRRRRIVARSTPAGIGLHVGRFDPGRRQRQCPRTVCGCHGVRQRHRAVAPLDSSDPESRRADVGRNRSVRPELQQRTGRCGVVGEATRAQNHIGPGRLERRALELGPPTGQQWIARLGLAAVRLAASVPRARRSAASTIDCQPVQRQRWARRPASTSRRTSAAESGRPRPRFPAASASSTASRIKMPGVQKPHWLAPWATNASAHRVRCCSDSPSSVVTARPATRRIGVTQATLGSPSTQTVQHPH